MSYADFLSEGAPIPAGSALTATTTQTSGPSWHTDYIKNLIAQQAAQGGAAYSPYQGPRVAPFTPDQINSFQQTRDAAGAYAPGLATATNTAGQAAATSGSGAAAPWLNTAGGTIQQGINQPGGMGAAQGYLDRAGGTVENVDSYMNPYQSEVVNRIGELGQRNLMEKIMPGLEGRYIRAGQFQGSGQMTDTARAVRDTSADILAAQSQAMQAGYTNAQTMKGNDLNRQGTLASTAGNLGAQDRTTTLQGGQMQAQIGQTAGNLGVQDAQNLNNVAQTQGNLAGAAQGLGLTGANAVNAAGQQQEAKTQANYDVAYADFLRQQGWPQDQIDKQVATMKGLEQQMPSQKQEQGIVPTQYAQPYKPGTTDKIATGIGALATGIAAGNEAGWW